MPLKILHILDHSLPLHSGYTFRSHNIFKAQQNMGFHPVVLTSPKHEQSWKGDWSEVEEIDGITYYRTGGIADGGFLPVVPELRLMRALTGKFSEVVAKEKPDVIQAHSPFLNAMAVMKAARKKGIPTVYEIRAFWEDAAVDHRTYGENSWKYRLVRAMETRVCRRADYVTVICEGLKQDLVNRGISEKKISIIFNGINPESFTTTSPDHEFQKQYGLKDKKVIGFIGSFYRYEGLDLLVRAFAKLAPEHPDLVLLLVGGGEMETELKQLAHNLTIAPNSTNSTNPTNPINSTNSINSTNQVIFPGRLPHEKVPGIYSLIDILVYPRYSMRLTDLVTPLKPLEAMAMGKALVASDVGGHKELIRDGENGVLFAAGNEEALAECLDNLLRDGQKQRKLQEKGPEWIRRHHTWKTTTSPYQSIYSSFHGKIAGRADKVVIL